MFRRPLCYPWSPREHNFVFILILLFKELWGTICSLGSPKQSFVLGCEACKWLCLEGRKISETWLAMNLQGRSGSEDHCAIHGRHESVFSFIYWLCFFLAITGTPCFLNDWPFYSITEILFCQFNIWQISHFSLRPISLFLLICLKSYIFW